jgi:hypothetical protein
MAVTGTGFEIGVMTATGVTGFKIGVMTATGVTGFEIRVMTATGVTGFKIGVTAEVTAMNDGVLAAAGVTQF